MIAPPLLAQAQAVWSASEMLVLAGVGVLVVFTALALVGVVMVGLGRLMAPPEGAPPPPAAVAEAEALGAGTELGLTGPATVALLTAAAVAAVGRPVRVRRVTFVRPSSASAWKEVGRATIQASHNFNR